MRNLTAAKWACTGSRRCCYYHFSLPEAHTCVPSLEPDNCISLIKQCRTICALRSVHASMLRSHLYFNRFFQTNLLSRYVLLGSVPDAYAVFSTSCSLSDPVLWNVMIQALTDTCQYERALLLYNQMRNLGVEPNSFTYPFVLKACGGLHAPFLGIQVHAHLVVDGWHSDAYVCNSLIAMYGKCKLPEMSLMVFENMVNKNLVSHNSVIGAFAQNGRSEEGWSLFLRILDGELRPNRGSVSNVMACICKESQADQIWRIVLDNELDSDQSVRNAAVQMYARCGRIDLARRVFDGIHDKDIVSWTSMIDAYAKADHPWEAMYMFKQMRSERVVPDYITLLSIIHAFEDLASFMCARHIHGFITCSFLKYPIELESALVSLYVKCGSLEYARKFFDRIPQKNLCSWTAIISGYGMHGHGREALLLFDQMKASLKPDKIIFLSVLSACSHCGLESEGWECFHSMIRDFGVIPGPEHYACMVDLLGRSGKVKDACKFIERMPIPPGIGVWGALLGACRIHSNVQIAELAAKCLIQLEADNSGRYVLLSNIYASSGKTKEANEIRSLMKHRGVKKSAGRAVLEINSKLYTFVAGDDSSPQANVIYQELEKLMEHICLDGYIPDMNLVLHDIQE